jgi:hypothetical protein
MEIKKTCSKCKEIKELNLFTNNKSTKDGKNHHCKKCVSNYYIFNKENLKVKIKEYSLQNKEKIKNYQKKYQILNVDKLKNYQKTYKNKKENDKKYYLKNKEILLAKHKEYLLKNKESLNKKVLIYEKERRKKDYLFKLTGNLRNRIYKAFKNNNYSKNNKTFLLLGEDIVFIKTFIENKFLTNMTWDNYGKWHIDHIIPLSSAKTEEELNKLCHYTNLQPLWALDNFKKGNKL